jgi:ATP-dependent 26S proteasome regulatory subunit
VKSPKLEKIHEMLEGSQLSDADEGKLLRSLESDAPALGLVARALARQRRGLRKDLTNAQAQLARVEAAFARLQIEPWFVGTFLRATADGRLDVSAGGRRQIVAIGPDVDAGKLEAGDEVFLTGEGVVVAHRARRPRRHRLRARSGRRDRARPGRRRAARAVRPRVGRYPHVG